MYCKEIQSNEKKAAKLSSYWYRLVPLVDNVCCAFINNQDAEP